MKKSVCAIALVSVLSISASYAGDSVDCRGIARKVTSAVNADKSEVLAIVSKYAQEDPDCACEVVKAAILSSMSAKADKADNKLVGQIVESALLAAPDQSAMIAQCATAVAPDAHNEIGDAINNVGGGGGGGDFPGGDNPLDFPGDAEGGIDGGSDSGGSGSGGDGGGSENPNPGDPGVITNPNP